ncbi:MAG TPA: phage portal protein [Clostridia bacterium]|nr:phage portal protein [Clostridia bacterium]
MDTLEKVKIEEAKARQLEAKAKIETAKAQQEIAAVQGKYLKNFSNTGYSESGASRKKKALKGWDHDSSSPDKDIHDNAQILRERSRSLFMGTSIARSAINTNRTNIVGAGLRVQPSIDNELLRLSPEQADEWAKTTEKEFLLWAESKHCDASKLNNFFELQGVALIGWLINGDAFGIPKMEENNIPYMPYQLRIMLIEADRVRSPYIAGGIRSSYYREPSKTTTTAKNGNLIFDGVEVNSFGSVEAYYIHNSYPTKNMTSNSDYVRVKAYGDRTGMPNVIHVIEMERAEQYRGTPYLAPVIESLKQLSRYTEAEIMAAIVQSFFTAWIQYNTAKSENAMDIAIPEEERVDKEDPNAYEMGAGSINMLRPGETVEFGDPKHPARGFDVFMDTITKHVGSALEIPHEILVKEFKSSYSASRAALLEAWKAFKMRRSWFAADFCQPIYELWLAEAVATGRIRAPGFFIDPIIRKAWCRSEWIGPAQGQIDPVKEVEASEKLISNGFSTHTAETVKLTGGDWEANMRQRKKENKLIGEVGDQNSKMNNQITEGGNGPNE